MTKLPDGAVQHWSKRRAALHAWGSCTGISPAATSWSPTTRTLRAGIIDAEGSGIGCFCDDLAALAVHETRELPTGDALAHGSRHLAYHLEDAVGSTRRVIGIKEGRQVLFDIAEVIVAEAAGRTVWLRTDLGRIKSATDGIDKINDQFSECGFMRVHRSYLVNLSRVREVERKNGGELELTVGDNGGKIPVSRRRAKSVAAALGLVESPA